MIHVIVFDVIVYGNETFYLSSMKSIKDDASA